MQPMVNEPNRKVYIYKNENSPVVWHECTVPELKPCDYKLFTENYFDCVNLFSEMGGKDVSGRCAGKLSVTELKKLDGRSVVH